jgi:enamine deaminase RidA (YjgF/YER057c/UK114 family)
MRQDGPVINAVHAKPEVADAITWVPAIELRAAGTILFLSGDTASRLPEDITEETRLCLASIESVLAGRGLRRRHIVKVTTYVTDMREGNRVRTVLDQHFGDDRPASTPVYVNSVSAPGARVELDVIAAGPQDASPKGERRTSLT